MIVLVLLELAVARGSLSFTLTVLLHVHEMGIPLDARALPTVQRFAALDAVADTKVRSYFSDSLRVDAASAAEVAGGGVDAGVELASDDAMKDTDPMPGRRTVPEAGAGAEVGPSSERDSAGGVLVAKAAGWLDGGRAGEGRRPKVVMEAMAAVARGRVQGGVGSFWAGLRRRRCMRQRRRPWSVGAW